GPEEKKEEGGPEEKKEEGGPEEKKEEGGPEEKKEGGAPNVTPTFNSNNPLPVIEAGGKPTIDEKKVKDNDNVIKEADQPAGGGEKNSEDKKGSEKDKESGGESDGDKEKDVEKSGSGKEGKAGAGGGGAGGGGAGGGGAGGDAKGGGKTAAVAGAVSKIASGNLTTPEGIIMLFLAIVFDLLGLIPIVGTVTDILAGIGFGMWALSKEGGVKHLKKFIIALILEAIPVVSDITPFVSLIGMLFGAKIPASWIGFVYCVL
ncbi:MAG: hypothetical protein WCW01_06990, partial [Gammaproteobacteria bacterium]